MEFQACPLREQSSRLAAWTHHHAQQGIVKVSILMREDFGLKWCLSEG
jgi:hypothetical protein